jgi:hypothetical protein
MVGLLWAAALLLGSAGLAKLFRPGPAARAVLAAELPGASLWSARPVIRLLGVAEVVVAGWVIVVGGSLPAALLGGCYLLLTLVAWRMIRYAPGQDCGCFGADSEPISRSHIFVNGAYALTGAAAAYWPQPSIVDEFAANKVWTVLLAGLAGLLAWLSYLLMTEFPALLAIRAKVAAAK